jgi:hypothetical protein
MPVGPDRQVGAGFGGLEVGGGGAPAALVLGGRLVVAAALLPGAVEVGIERNAGLLAGFEQGFGDFPFVGLVGDSQRSAGAVVFVGAAFVVLGFAEVGQDRGVVPAFVAKLAPLVVVGGVAAHIDHAVDRAGATEHLAAGLVHGAAVELLFRFGFEFPVHPRIDEGFRVAHRDVDPEFVVVAAGFQQQDLVAAGFAEAGGKDATGGTGAGHDIVVGFSHVSNPGCSGVGGFHGLVA